MKQCVIVAEYPPSPYGDLENIYIMVEMECGHRKLMRRAVHFGLVEPPPRRCVCRKCDRPNGDE